jgi:hypothetical protein
MELLVGMKRDRDDELEQKSNKRSESSQARVKKYLETRDGGCVLRGEAR